MKSQAAAAESVRGDHIVKYYKTFEFPEFIYLVSELSNTNLKTLMVTRKNGFQEKEIKEIASQIVKAMKEIRAKDCAFNTMNPYNIFEKDGVWKVGGFTKK